MIIHTLRFQHFDTFYLVKLSYSHQFDGEDLFKFKRWTFIEPCQLSTADLVAVQETHCGNHRRLYTGEGRLTLRRRPGGRSDADQVAAHDGRIFSERFLSREPCTVLHDSLQYKLI